MTEALALKPQDKVLEVGTGSGYAAAVLGKITADVYTIERHAELAELAESRLHSLGINNVHVVHGDGTLGLPEHAPYDAIVVAAGGRDVPQPLLDQLAVGGRLVIPTGDVKTSQELLRITRTGQDSYRREKLGAVRFVPLIGARGWQEEIASETAYPPCTAASSSALISELIRESAEPIQEIEGCDLGSLLERIGNSRLVLIGEATHGTSEFYRMRAEITKQLIMQRGFQFVAIEADWPDAARVDAYIRQSSCISEPWEAFARFPNWMWRNREVLKFVEWLRTHNQTIEDRRDRVAFYGLDIYSIFTSIRAVLKYLDRVDPQAAEIARLRYGCLTPWEGDPALYGRMAIAGRYRVCEHEAVAMLRHLLEQRRSYAERDGTDLMSAVQNARLIANAERYYRIMYYGSNESWNVRDQHMFDTLELLLGYHGTTAKAVIWEHNSHLGDASATEMGAGGQTNVGELCRGRFGTAAYLIGQGTDHGTVAAAANWDEPVDFMQVRTAFPGSYENLCHESRVEVFLLPLRYPRKSDVRVELNTSRLERAIGVVYRPDTELASHYFHALLANQFDEFIWFDRTRAVSPLSTEEARQLPPNHPFWIGA
jgi:protein-L-isoaspartate(D-aspartate) O-methyltransferase